MPIGSKKVKTLYDALVADGADVGTEDEFNSWFFASGDKGYKNRKSVFDAFKADGADVGGSYEEFAGLIGLRPVKKAAVSRQPVQTPQGFGQTNADYTNRIGMGNGPVSWEDTDNNYKRDESVVDKTSRMMGGKATPQEQNRVQSRMRQRMDEAEYENETVQRMRQPVLSPEWEAPTVVRDEYGNIRHDDNGNIIKGFSTDEDVADTHRQIVQDQKEWDALSDEERRQREKDARLRIEMLDYKEPSLWDTAKKDLGSGIVRMGANLLDFMQQMSSGMIVEDPSSPTGYTKTRDYEEALNDKNDPMTIATKSLHDTSERLHREAQPRKGRDFLDMLWDGDLGGFLQKGVGTAFESLPMTLSIFNPTTMIANGILLASGNYRDETINNPDIPAWERASYAITSAAIEQAVEKYADPFFKYVGGGKILGKMGKDASGEFAKKVTQDATESLAKQIYHGILGVTKDAAGEGAEEVITNLGTDIAGETIDLISGDKNYGLRAQWEKHKKEHPEADLWDFAFDKAKENVESFIAGSMAGAYTSGSAQASAKAISYGMGRLLNEEDIENNPDARIDPVTLDIAQSYDEGYNTNDADAKKRSVEETQAAADNLPKYGEKFAEMVMQSESPVETTDYLLQNRDYYTDEQIAAAYDYYQKKAVSDGMMDAALDGIDLQVESANGEVMGNTHSATGQVVTAQIGNGAYYILGGDIVIDEDTGMPVVTGTGGAVVVKDAQTGEISVKAPRDVIVTSMENADDMIQYNETVLRQQLEQQADDDITYGNPANEVYNIEDTVTLQDGEGGTIEGEITELPNSDDGVFAVQTNDKRPGKAVQYFTADELNRRIVAHNGMEVQRGSQGNEQILTESEQNQASFLQNPTQNAQNAGNYAQNQPQNISEVSGNTLGENVNTPKETPVTPEESQQSAAGRIPLNEKGEPDYLQAQPQDSYDSLVEDLGEEDANTIIESEIGDAQKRLARLQKKAPQGATIEEKKRNLSERRAAMEAEQSAIDYWNSVLEIPKTRKAEAERKAEEEERRRAEENRRAMMQTPDGRQQLLSEARNSQERSQIAKEIYGEYINENIGEPDTAEELVSLLLPYGKLNWEGYQRGTSHVRGLQEELGSGHTRGLSKSRGTSGFNSYLAKKGEGESLDDIVHQMYTSDANISGDEHRFSTEEIKDAAINMLLEAEKPTDIRDYTINSRIDAAERTLRAELEAEADEWADAYHLTPEEREQFEAYLEMPPTEPEIEVINQIIAEYEQDTNGAGVDRGNTDEPTVAESEGSQVDVPGQSAAEEAGANNEQQPAGRTEDGTGGEALPDNNVAGGTQGPAIAPSEQLKPTDLRDAIRPESAELGVSEANAKARALTNDEAESLMQRMEASATPDPQISLTPETWAQTFGLNNSLKTPIGNVKMGEGQYQKFFDKSRSKEFGMAVETLRDPDIILIEPSQAKEGQTTERPYSYIFVKTFDRNGEKVKYYASVTVQRDNMEVSVSSHYMKPAKVFERLTTLERLYTKETLLPNSSEWHLAEQQNAVPDLLPTQENNVTSDGKGTNNSPNNQENLGKTSSPEEISAEEAKVDTNPTEAQKEAGNYQKGHINVDGYDITIENPKGSVRSGVDSKGNRWETTMRNTYGYIRGTEGVDGDHIDVFLSDNPSSGSVFVVDQVNPETGAFDEHKVMYGFASEEEAREAYLANYAKGWKGLGTITEVSREEFKKWVESSHRKTKPFRDYALAKREQARQAKENILNALGELQDNGRQYEDNKPEAYELGVRFAMTLPAGTTSKEALRLASEALDANKAKGGLYALPFFDGVTETVKKIPGNNENKLNNDDVISDIDENDVPLQRRSRKSYTDREGVYHEGLEEELEHIEESIRSRLASDTAAGDSNLSSAEVPDVVSVEASEGMAEGTDAQDQKLLQRYPTVAELRRRASMIRAELARRERAREDLRQKYNINEKGDVSLDDLARMFHDLNSDEAIGKLFDRVLGVLKRLKLDYRFTDKLPGGVNGRAQTLLNMTFYDWDAQTRDMDDQQKARVLLHEMIHNVTSQILLYARKMPLLLALSPKQLSAARKLNRIYQEVAKVSPKRANGKAFYAIDSVDEMVAELANPEFRETLSQIEVDGRSLWQRIKDAIRELFGLETTPNMANALKESGDILEDILDTFGPVESFAHGVPRQAAELFNTLANNEESLIDSTEADLQSSKGNNLEEERSLMGVHNISEEKLKKALKQGGLANPSMAVFDTNNYAHTDYGEISLIPKASLIDSRTGRNAGTYSGDAWTPTYPHVERFLTKKGDKHRLQIAKEAADGDAEMERHLAGVINDYVEGNGDRMHFLFLKQKGLNPEVRPERTTHSHEEFEEIQKIFGEGTSTLPSNGITKEQNQALLDLMTRGYEEQIRKQAEMIKDESKREAAAKLMLERKLNDLVDENGNIWFAKGDTFVYENWRDEQRRKNPKPDWYGTDNDASYRVAKEGLAEEYEKWKEDLLGDEDIDEKLFAGWTDDGRKRYVANTVQNASRLMNKEADTNSYGNGGVNASKAGLLKKLKTLSDIRKYRHLLKSEDQIKEQAQQASDEWFDIIHQVSDMQKVDSNPFINVDIAEARLQEAMTNRDPIGYLNKEYRYSIDRNSDLASDLMNFIEKAKEMPVKYFETKFKRPVGIDEFAIAVVPTTTSQEIVEALKNAGLDVRTYERSSIGDANDEARIKATMDAVKERDDILFQKAEAAPGTPAQNERTLRDALVDHLKSAGIDVVTDLEEGQRTMDNPEAMIKPQKVTDQTELEALNNGPTVKRYRAMQLIDGKLYPPMSAKVNGEMREPTEIGVWEKAEERPDLVKNGKFVLNKGQKGQGNVPAAYNPYFHTSTSGLNDQFTSAYKRPELVVVEVEIPESELTSGYKAEGAKDAVGNVEWHSGVVNGQLPADRQRQVTLSRYSKVNRIVPDSEVADMIAKQLEGTDIEVPYNVVTPGQRAELEKRGVKISSKPAGSVTEDINGNPIRQHKVYHGSGAEFDAFDHSHMGEGEGYQTFGYGTYVTDVSDVAEGYAEKGARKKYNRLNQGYGGKEVLYKGKKIDLQTVNPLKMAYDMINNEGTVNKAIRTSERLKGYAEDPEMQQKWQDVIDILKDSKKSDFKARMADLSGQRYVYEVEIPDDNGENYLDYDSKPTEKQLHNIVGKFLESGLVEDPVKEMKIAERLRNAETIGNIIDILHQNIGGESTAKLLHDAGYVGTKYPTNYMAGGNRKGKKNYVIYDESDAKITDVTKFFRTSDGQAYGYTYNGKIYIDPSIATAETPVHEYTHLWAEAVRQNDPETWDNIVDVLKKDPAVRPFWNKVAAQYPELTDDNDIAEEVLAQYSGKRGSEKLREVADDIARENGGIFGKAQAVEALRKMRNILDKFWKAVSDMMGWQYTRAEEVADKVLSDLLNGVKPETEGRDTVMQQRADEDDIELEDLDDTAMEMYNKAMQDRLTKVQEAWQDSMVSLKALQDAIAAETGNKANGAEDAYAYENRMHGRSKNMSEQFDWQYYQPMLKAFDDFCRERGLTDEQAMDYLVAKHGLERNMYYGFRDALKQKVADEIKDEREELEKAYALGRISEDVYKQGVADLREKELSGVDDAISQLMESDVYKRLKDDYLNGRISYAEFISGNEQLRREATRRKRPKMDSEGHVVSDNYYDEVATDFSGLTETFAKEAYDEAQKVKRQADREIDKEKRRKLYGLYNKRMREAYEQAREEADRRIAEAETEPTPKPASETAAGKLWDAINAATKKTLQISFESGMMDRKTYNKVRDMFDFYIPLRGWEEDKASDVYSYVGRDNVFSPAVKKTWGRKSKADSPLAYIGNIAASTIISGHHNLMKQHFLNYVLNNPTSLVNISESWYENTGTERNPNWVLRTADTAGKSADEIATIVNDFNEEMEQKQAEGKAMPVRGRLRLDVHATSGQKAEHVVEVQRAGRTYQLYINGDPRAAQALNGTLAKAVSRISQTFVGKHLVDLERNMAAFFTSKNPAFVVSNLSRDLNMAGASVAIKESPAYNAKFMANVAKVLAPRMGESSKWGPASKQPTGLMPSLMRKWQNGTLDTSNETERLFKEFMDEGGETGFVNMLSVDSFKEKMQKEISQMHGSDLLGRGAKETTAKKGLRMMGETFEFYNRCAEDATRFIVYMTSRQMGKSLEESIADAKDVTLNFNRKGSGALGNADIRDLFIFVNPAIQALSNMYYMAKGHPLKFAGIAGLFFAGGMIMPIMNQWMLSMWGDDEDKEAYWNLPPWVRKNNLVMWIPFTKNFLTIPLAQEFRVFYGAGEMLTSAVTNHHINKPGLEIISSVADLVPINPTGNGGNLMIDFTFTGAQPLMQLAFNTDFTGKPIWKENQSNEHAPAYTKAYITTPSVMIKLSEKINSLTGGNEGRKGWLEEWTGNYVNNPAVWNHLLQGYLGGMYNTIARTADVMATTADWALGDGEKPKMLQMPVLNRFLNRPIERDNAGVLGEDYYDLKYERDKIRYELNTFRQKAADGDPDAQAHVDEIMSSDDYKRAEIFDHYEKIINDLRKGEKAATESADKGDIKKGITDFKQDLLDELKTVGDGRDPLEVTAEQFSQAKTFSEKNKLRMRMERLMKEQEGVDTRKTKPRAEEVAKALSYITEAEDESREGNEAYMMQATPENVRDDARIKAVKARLKLVADELKKIEAERPERAGEFYRKHQKELELWDFISQQESAMKTHKKELGKGYDGAVTKMLDSSRKAMIDAIEKMK